jgi:phage repressor protein C with HTH and peptisase S24 domain
MAPDYKKGDYAYVEYNAMLNDGETGLFSLNGDIIIRKFALVKGEIILKANDKSIKDRTVIVEGEKPDEFFIIGKVSK